MCPDWESNRRPSGLQASAQSTEPHQPVQSKWFKEGGRKQKHKEGWKEEEGKTEEVLNFKWKKEKPKEIVVPERAQ